MRFRITLSTTFEAGSIMDALYVRRDAHYALEDVMVDRSIEDPGPDPRLHFWNLSHGMLEGLDEESRAALEQQDEDP